MGRDSEQQCKTCQAPDGVRDLSQRLRIAGVSLADTAECLKILRGHAISTAALSRHEQHWDKVAAATVVSDGVQSDEMSVRDIVKKKLKLYLAVHGEEVPNSTEIRHWLKLLADLQSSETEAEKMSYLRAMFVQQPKALTSGDVIDGEVLN